jgi:hypothetical protein
MSSNTEHIKIITTSGDVFLKRKTKIECTFQTLIDVMTEFPDQKEFPINLDSKQWRLIDNFVRYLQLPQARDDLIALARAASYLGPIGLYKKILQEELRKSLVGLGWGYILNLDLSFHDIAMRLEQGNNTPASLMGERGLMYPMGVYYSGHPPLSSNSQAFGTAPTYGNSALISNSR